MTETIAKNEAANAYHLEFLSPYYTTAASWRSGAASFPRVHGDVVTLSALPLEIPTDQPFKATIAVGRGEATRVFVSAFNWPVACDKALMIELQGAFDPFRSEAGLESYDEELVAGKAETLTVSCTDRGIVKVEGYLTAIEIDLKKMSVDTSPHAHRIVVVPAAGKQATILLGNGTVVMVKGA